jgi:hypothetical protein
MPIVSTGIASQARAERVEPIPWLICWSDCKDGLPQILAFAVLNCARDAQRLIQPASMKPAHHFSASWRRQLENGQIEAGSSGCTA